MSDPIVTENVSTDQFSGSSEKKARGFAWYILFALGLALFIRFFVAAPYVVAGASMENTFDNWDYLITDRLSYEISPPNRGDVVVFCLPHAGECSFFKRILHQQWSAPRTLIKRVIGLPGETVSVEGNTIRIVNAAHPEGFTLDEPYLVQEHLGGPSNVTTTLASDQYFVMGDNRRVSSDSRTWGTLPRENIIGHVLVRLFPLSHLGILPGDANYSEE